MTFFLIKIKHLYKSLTIGYREHKSLISFLFNYVWHVSFCEILFVKHYEDSRYFIGSEQKKPEFFIR